MKIFHLIYRGEQKASRALREASEIIGDSPAALQVNTHEINCDEMFLIFAHPKHPTYSLDIFRLIS